VILSNVSDKTFLSAFSILGFGIL